MHVSLAGVAVAVFAVFIAYFMGYANGVSLGRDAGFNDGKQQGSREGSIRAYAVGFDRGKRARDDVDEDEDGDDEGDEAVGSTNLGFAILAVAAGLFGVLWLTSHTPTAPIDNRGDASTLSTTTLPSLNADEIVNLTRPDPSVSPRPSGQVPESYPQRQQTVVLPKVNRALPTATPMPPQGSASVYYTPSEIEQGRRGYPHPPPAFRRP